MREKCPQCDGQKGYFATCYTPYDPNYKKDVWRDCAACNGTGAAGAEWADGDSCSRCGRVIMLLDGTCEACWEAMREEHRASLVSATDDPAYRFLQCGERVLKSDERWNGKEWAPVVIWSPFDRQGTFSPHRRKREAGDSENERSKVNGEKDQQETTTTPTQEKK